MRIALLTTLFALLVTEAAHSQATVIAVSGKVSIRRDGWSGWLPVRFGTTVGAGDLLHTGAGATLEVLCPDLTRGKLAGDETSGAPCDAARSPTRTEDGGPRLGPLRSGEPEHELTLFSPRWTLVEEIRPIIRWSAPAGVGSVQVTIVGVGFKWSTKATGRSMVYPADAPRLIPGRQYSVLVTAGSLASTRDGEAWPLFEILSPGQVTDLKNQVAKVRALPLNAEKKAFLEASFLAGRGLRAAAIDRLLPIAATSQEPAVRSVLASVYEHTGLERLAIENYRIAVARFATLADLDGEGRAATMLGQLCRRSAHCEENEDQRLLQRALAIYEQVGAQDEVKRLRGLI